jgi:hypothetical protein
MLWRPRERERRDRGGEQEGKGRKLKSMNSSKEERQTIGIFKCWL